MKNKQKIYFILNLTVLLPLLLVALVSLLYTISDYLSMKSLWIEWLKDFSLWYIDMILDFTAKNNTTRGGLEEMGFALLTLIFQAILSLVLIIAGYFSHLLKGFRLKILIGIYIASLLLFFISIPIHEQVANRIPESTSAIDNTDGDRSCQVDSDCVIKQTFCSTPASCSVPLGCVNKAFTPPTCPKNPSACSDVVLPRPNSCFCEKNICVGEGEKFNVLIKQDADQAIEFCAKYLFNMNTGADKVDLCKASVSEILLDTDYSKAVTLCKSNGRCGYDLAQKIAKMGYKEDSLAICNQAKYQSELCYTYIAFEIAKYDYSFAKAICPNIKEQFYYDECINNIENRKPN